ncbi:hypothetical protein GCM10010413_53370 [Promicromonospora sukumoe]
MIQAWASANAIHRVHQDENTRMADRRRSRLTALGDVDRSDGLGTGHIFALIGDRVGDPPIRVQVRAFAS